jgi:hypothetical protein
MTTSLSQNNMTTEQGEESRRSLLFRLPCLTAICSSLLFYTIKAETYTTGIFFTSAVLLSLLIPLRYRMSFAKEIILALLFTGLAFILQGVDSAPVTPYAVKEMQVFFYYCTIFALSGIIIKTYKVKSITDFYHAYILALLIACIALFYPVPDNTLGMSILFLVFSFLSIFLFNDFALMTYRNIDTGTSYVNFRVIPLLIVLPLLGIFSFHIGGYLSDNKVAVMEYMTRQLSSLPIYSFPQVSRLGTMDSIYKSDRIVMRVFTDDPGAEKLKGRVYNHYDRGQWSTRSENISIENIDENTVRELFIESGKIFPMYAQPEVRKLMTDKESYFNRQGYKLEFKSNQMIFHPANSILLSGNFKNIMLDSTGNIESYPEANQYEIISLKNLESKFRENQNPPTPDDLVIPESIFPDFKAKTLEVTGDTDDVLKKITTIEQYLQENYKYKLGISLKTQNDPVYEFLINKRDAHCEYFASAMTLMLRSIDIPARYTVGFVMNEYQKPDNCFVVREKHAHAWVQVFIEGKGWVEFDPTPPSWQLDTKVNIRTDWLNYFSSKFKNLYEHLKNGSFREFISEIKTLAADLKENQSATSGIVLILSGGILYLTRRKIMNLFENILVSAERRRNSKNIEPEDPEVKQLLLILSEFDRYIAGINLKRPLNLTLLEFADFIEKNITNPDYKEKTGKLLDFLKTYSSLRYQCGKPENQDIELLRNKLEAIWVDDA